jgi:hypothetical protein
VAVHEADPNKIDPPKNASPKNDLFKLCAREAAFRERYTAECLSFDLAGIERPAVQLRLISGMGKLMEFRLIDGLEV